MPRSRTTRSSRLQRGPARRSGFTLVEMLVAVALVLMLMTLFGTIFQIATGSMTKQRGISEQDQRARMLSTVIRKDVQHRTARYPLAFHHSENPTAAGTRFPDRNGYLYISTNNPDSGLDDILQFTVSAAILKEDSSDTPYFGLATELLDRRVSGASLPGLAISPNQPEADDGSLAANSVASSPYAEISYFIRGGNLYRSILLLRDPLKVAGQELISQPTARSGWNFFSGQPDPANPATYDGLFLTTAGKLTNDFYRFFDHSAWMDDTGGLYQARFLGAESLNNSTTGVATVALGIPRYRFGFNSMMSPTRGRSREHTNLNTSGTPPSLFLGRLTLAERSAFNFNHPQNRTTEETGTEVDGPVYSGGNPMDPVQMPLTLNPGNGLVREFDGSVAAGPVEGRGGSRRVEDLLLAGCHEMKIELWDDRLGRFVPPGHLFLNRLGEPGDYHQLRVLNKGYGPRPVADPVGPGTIVNANRGSVFDTWHPDVAGAINGVDYDGSGAIELLDQSPPYIAYEFYPPVYPAGPSSPTMTGPFANYWMPGTPYNPGQVVFPQWTDNTAPIGVFSYEEVKEPRFRLAFRCIAGGTSGATTDDEPAWPTKPGQRVTDGTTGLVWESFDNRRPLQAIRLTVRYHERTSDNMRQLSLVMPLTDESQ